MTIDLTPEAEATVRDLVARGAYPSAAAALDAAVALLRERAELRRLIQEGIDSGPSLSEEEVFGELESLLDAAEPAEPADRGR